MSDAGHIVTDVGVTRRLHRAEPDLTRDSSPTTRLPYCQYCGQPLRIGRNGAERVWVHEATGDVLEITP